MRPVIRLSALSICVLSSSLSVHAAAYRPKGAEKTATQIRNRKLAPFKSILRQAVITPGPTGDTVRTAIKERKEVLFNQDKELPRSVREARTTIAPLFKDDVTRDLTVSRAQERLQQESILNWVALKDQYSKRNEIPVFDEVVVGMGPHGASYAQAKTTFDPNRKVLIIDESDVAGGTFAKVASVFALNSTNRKNDGERAGPGRGDLNRVHDIVGLPDIRATRWVDAGLLGDVTVMGVALSSAAPLLETRLVGVEPIRGSQDVMLQLRDTSSEGTGTIRVRAKKLVFTSGLGKEKSPFTDAQTNRYLEAEKGKDNPAIESFKAFVDRIAKPENRKPLRDLFDKDIALIGAGDSGKVLAELLTGIGPDAAYKEDTAQVGNVRKIYWFVGLEGIKNCEEYIKKTRARYSRIAQALNSGVLVPVPGRVTALAKSGEGYTATYQYKDEVGKLRQRSREIVYSAPADPRRNLPARTESDSPVLGKVIYATGFDNELPALLGKVTDRSFEDAWEKISVKDAAFGGKSSAIARSLIDRPNILLAGPANESLGGLPDKNELKGINENTVSLFANIARTEALARYNGKEELSAGAARNTLYTNRPVLDRNVVLSAIDNAFNPPEAIEVAAYDNVFDIRRVDNPELALRSALDGALQGWTVSAGGARQVSEVEMLFLPGKKEDTYRVFFQGAQPIDRAALVDRLEEEEGLDSVLFRDYFAEGSRVKGVRVRVPVLQSGKLAVSRMEVTVKY